MNSLFFSLEYFVNESQYVIRQKICDYIQNNLEYVNSINIDNSISIDNNYILNMRNNNTPGTNIEIQVACNIYKSKIIVYNNNNTKKEFIPTDTNYNKTYEIIKNNNFYKYVFNTLMDNF
jgi:hypothetical protein